MKTDIKIIAKIIKNNQLIFVAVAIPIVIDAKYIDNSKGDLTGFLNLTIDKAPTIPSESAMLPEITEVII